VTTNSRNSSWVDMATIASCVVGPVGLSSAIGMCESPCQDSLRRCLEYVGNQGEGGGIDGGAARDGDTENSRIEGCLLTSQGRCCDAYIDSRYATDSPHQLDRLSLPGSAIVSRGGVRNYGGAVQRPPRECRHKDNAPLAKTVYVFVRLKSHALKPSSTSSRRAIVFHNGRV